MKHLFISILFPLYFFISNCSSIKKNNYNLELNNTETKTLAPVSSKSMQKIAFGSCNKQDYPQNMWRTIIKEKPELWIWMGDAIYAKTEDPRIIKEKYEEQLSNIEYKLFLNSNIPIIGTWDDNDYGPNNGNISF